MDILQVVIHMLHKTYGYKSEEILNLFMLFRHLHLQAGKVFLEQGAIVNTMALLMEGLLVCESTDKSGNITVNRFIYEGGNRIVTDYVSFLKQEPSAERIIAIEKSHLLVISQEDFKSKLLPMPEMYRILLDITADLNTELKEQRNLLQIPLAMDRIDKFMSMHKSLYNRASKTRIASFLRINRNDLAKMVNHMKP